MIQCQWYIDRGYLRSVVVKSKNVKLESVKSEDKSVTAESVMVERVTIDVPARKVIRRGTYSAWEHIPRRNIEIPLRSFLPQLSILPHQHLSTLLISPPFITLPHCPLPLVQPYTLSCSPHHGHFRSSATRVFPSTSRYPRAKACNISTRKQQPRRHGSRAPNTRGWQ